MTWSAREDRVAASGLRGGHSEYLVSASAVEPPPDQPVERDDVEAHHDHAGQDLRRMIPGRGRLGDVGPEAGGDQVVVAVGDDLGDDRGVPGAARRGDPAGDVGREDAGQDELAASAASRARRSRPSPRAGPSGSRWRRR